MPQAGSAMSFEVTHASSGSEDIDIMSMEEDDMYSQGSRASHVNIMN